ncbi:MAG: hypothetical protein J7L21_01895 [Sulfurimonas sp.]|nr:hypothetical protein [Sulfurimonas sp.]
MNTEILDIAITLKELIVKRLKLLDVSSDEDVFSLECEIRKFSLDLAQAVIDADSD